MLVTKTFKSDPVLLKKYDVSGPRYTSYPTAAQFTDTFNEQDYLQALNNDVSSKAPLSLYIHLPFCRSICYYCACNKIVTKDKTVVRHYLDYLRKEMALIRLQLDVYQRPVTQLHWGGGTPTFLDEAEMTELMHHTASYFTLETQQGRDYSIEIDPRTVNHQTIDLLRGLGFNRVSLGVQDVNKTVQKAINRVQDIDELTDLVAYIRTRSFRSLNFDLIYGLPFQTEITMNQTLDKVIELSPDRISCYNYAHLPERFTSQRAIDRHTLPNADQKVGMLALIIRRFTEAGYVYIGMDHFVKPDDSLAIARQDGTLCRNFQGYSIAKATDLVGMGVSSISSFDRVYAQNHRTLEHYYQALDASQLPVAHGLMLTDEDVLRRTVIQRLSCYRELNIPELEGAFSIDFKLHFSKAISQLEPLIEDDIIELSQNSLAVTDKGFPFLRNICMAFDQYLEESRQKGYTYSKTL
ncbi:MAG: oxygen-independent coproporphyrinogen III oxidase [Pseudomonadales bacterium]|nr:oxygen-independent coproporphyrinogen III oxidase [Pseudomonadales bacterium]